MKNTLGIRLIAGSREESLPDFAPEFPYLASQPAMDSYPDRAAPWHWHRAVELFYMESGTLEYTTPHGQWVFPAGTGGLVNSNVLHSTRVLSNDVPTIMYIHLFDTDFIAGASGSRMETKYILPLTAAPGLELIPLDPKLPAQAAILRDILDAFSLSEREWGYEFALREALTHIWMQLFAVAQPALAAGRVQTDAADDKIKMLMGYIHEHFAEPLSVDELAQTAHISRRACFRLFRDNLHMTPVEYIRSYRLQKACWLLTKTRDPITQIGDSCGLGSGSYFGKIFRGKFGCSPLEYRRLRHDPAINVQK